METVIALFIVIFVLLCWILYQQFDDNGMDPSLAMGLMVPKVYKSIHWVPSGHPPVEETTVISDDSLNVGVVNASGAASISSG